MAERLFGILVAVDTDELANSVAHLMSPSWFDQAFATDSMDNLDEDDWEPWIDRVYSIIKGEGLDCRVTVLADDGTKDREGVFDYIAFIRELALRGVFAPVMPQYNNGLDYENESIDSALQIACFGEEIYG